MTIQSLMKPGTVTDTSVFDAYWLTVIAHCEVEDQIRDILDDFAKKLPVKGIAHDIAISVLVRLLEETVDLLEESYDHYLTVRDDPEATERDVYMAIQSRINLSTKVLSLRASIRKLEAA